MELLNLQELTELDLGKMGACVDDNPTIKNGYPSLTVKAFSNILVKFRKLELFRMKIYCANRLFLSRTITKQPSRTLPTRRFASSVRISKT